MEEIPLPGNFDGPYQQEWNLNRTTVLRKALGDEWFKDKRILEVGYGLGSCGLILKDLGAIVIFADGREEFVNRLKILGHDAVKLDNNTWEVEPIYDMSRFDLIVHWGLLYHLTNWKDDLKNTLDRTNLLCLESEVRPNPSHEYEENTTESGYDQAISGVATVTSPATIEAEIRKLGATFERFDIPQLNVPGFEYDWDQYDLGKVYARGQARRFWLVRKYKFDLKEKQ